MKTALLLGAIGVGAIAACTGCKSVGGTGEALSGYKPLPGDAYTFGWYDRFPEPVDPGYTRTATMSVGAHVYKVEYGAEPGTDEVKPVLTDRGLNWRQDHGFFYIWGHWVLFETERTRTITWGTAAAARMLAPDTSNPEREQIIVRCGRVLVMPRSPSATTFAPMIIEAVDSGSGPVPVYVVITTTVDANGVETIELSAPTPVPTSSTQPNPDNIRQFFDAIVSAHPDCD